MRNIYYELKKYVVILFESSQIHWYEETALQKLNYGLKLILNAKTYQNLAKKIIRKMHLSVYSDLLKLCGLCEIDAYKLAQLHLF